ncbi:MAG: hypothetical protein KF798_03035 [Candidatus Paracaedibacteraceae bacterium]|nr:hypothetical protein [Candidatus Paracaedibacteraceae bacterium]
MTCIFSLIKYSFLLSALMAPTLGMADDEGCPVDLTSSVPCDSKDYPIHQPEFGIHH